MSTTLQPVSDPVQAHNLWKAGLLVNSGGSSWINYENRSGPARFSDPYAEGFLGCRADWFICLEE